MLSKENILRLFNRIFGSNSTTQLVAAEGANNQIEISDISNFVNSSIVIKGSNNRVLIKNGIFESFTLKILGNNCAVTIDENCVLRLSSWVIAGDDGSISVGAKTSSEGANLAVYEGKAISIGKDCMLSSNIRIYTSDVHSLVDDNTGKRINPAADVVLGDHVWVANSVQIFKGSSVASGSTVGAASVITKRFDEENVVIAGNPGVIKKRGVSWDRRFL